MARWTRDEVLNQPDDFVQFMMEDFLTKNGFKKKTHKGQEVWQEGDIMALGDHGMLAVGKSVDAVALNAMKEMLDEECELVTIYYGADVPGHEAEALREQVQEQYPDKEIELQYGGQPIYYYLISAE